MDQNHILSSVKFLSLEEEASLRRVLEMERSRNTLMLTILLECGMRCGELLLLRKKDIYVQSRSIFVQGLKGSNDRELPVKPEVFMRLLEMIVGLGDEDLLFDISYERLLQIWHFYRPVKKKLHSLRHTCAIRIYQKKKDLKLTQLILGHKNIASTMVYQNFLVSQDLFREVLCG